MFNSSLKITISNVLILESYHVQDFYSGVTCRVKDNGNSDRDLEIARNTARSLALLICFNINHSLLASGRIS